MSYWFVVRVRRNLIGRIAITSVMNSDRSFTIGRLKYPGAERKDLRKRALHLLLSEGLIDTLEVTRTNRFYSCFNVLTFLFLDKAEQILMLKDSKNNFD